MRIPPQVSERVREAPTQALRAVFSGIGQVLLVADRIKNRATDQGRPQPGPSRAGTKAPGSPTPTPAKDETRWRSLDETGNVRVLSEEDRAKATPEPAPATAAEPAVEPEPAVVAEPEPEPGVAVGAEDEPAVVAETEAVVIVETEAVVVGEAEPVVVTETEAVIVAEPEPAAVAEAVAVAETEPVVVAETEPAVVAETEPVAAVETEPAAAAVPEPAAVAVPEPGAALPVPNYDELTVASLRARLRNLDVAQLRVLIDYERAHAGREAVVTMFERRVAKLESGGA